MPSIERSDNRNARRWALPVLCLGELMIVLDTTIVNVALPSIQQDLGFEAGSLVWVVNAYLLTFGGFLLLGGRLGDLFGRRKLFLAGIVLFSLASLACGLARSQGLLIAARAIQGLGGALVSAIALSIIMTLFTDPQERARAMGVYGFVCAGGGSVGVLLGGVLTHALSWHWIFLVNLPIGAAVFGLATRFVPTDVPDANAGHLDVAGALTVTAGLMLAVEAIINGRAAGWTSGSTVATFGSGIGLLGVFVAIEARASAPLMPLGLFRQRSLTLANIVAVLWAAAMFAWFFIAALYLQRVLHYSALEVGTAFLPSNLIMAAFSLGISARLVLRFGVRLPLAGGLALATAGLILFAFAPTTGSFWAYVLPGMLLLGVGAGVAFNPVLIAAMQGVSPTQSGLASGIVNTAFMMGGALGLAVLASAAAARSAFLARSGVDPTEALSGGYQVAFTIGAMCAALAAVLALAIPVEPEPKEALFDAGLQDPARQPGVR